MSLFRFKDWWSVQCASAEEFGQYSVCVANIDNSITGSDKIIIGSLSGILRIFSVGFNQTEEGLPSFNANNLLMEMDFKLPILQVSTGLLLSATTNIQLAVLHPKKVSIYSISSTAGVIEHGSAYNILLIYEHSLQRSAFNMTLGPFGHVRGKDFLCVQSLDGNLVFYERESLAFNRFLPNSLLPGAIAYVPQSDSFVLATSLWTIESFRYQVLAIANSEEKSTNSNSTDTHIKGRKVTPDWSLSLGESVIDIKVVSLEKCNYLMVLGERSLFAVKENGSLWFMKKFDFNPSCLTAYSNDTNDSVISLIATHVSTLIIYSNDRAMWATQLPFTPISIHRAFFPNLTGAIVCLSDDGLICCGYLGTNPSIKIISVPNSQLNQINYSETETELQELRKIINSQNLDANQIDTKVLRKDLIINICDIQTISSLTSRISNPLLKLSVQLQSTSNVSNVRMAVELHKSLVAEPDIVTIPSVSNTSESVINEIIVYKNSQLFPASTKLDLIVTYTNEDGAPRVITKSIHIPINIFAKLAFPTKEAENRLTFDIINTGQPISLTEIFSDLYENESTSTSTMGIEIYDDHNVVSIITSIKTSQKFVIQSESFASMAFIANELLRRLAKNDIKYDISDLDISFIPLNKLFVLIDQHLLARHQVIDLQNSLSSSAAQFRAIQKRLLIKLKDRNPTPLNNLETLLKVSQTQINAFADKLVEAVNDLNDRKSQLSSAVNLVYKLIAIATEMKANSLKPIHSILANHISNDLDEGWEERTELSLITLLDSYGKEMSNATKIAGELTIPEKSDNIKRLLNILVNRVFKNENFNNKELNRDVNQKKFIASEPIAEEEESAELLANDSN